MMKMGLLPWLDAHNDLDWVHFAKTTDHTVNSVVNAFMQFLSD